MENTNKHSDEQDDAARILMLKKLTDLIENDIQPFENPELPGDFAPSNSKEDTEEEKRIAFEKMGFPDIEETEYESIETKPIIDLEIVNLNEIVVEEEVIVDLNYGALDGDTVPAETEFDDNKAVFNLVELMATENIEPNYLMSPIFPQKGTAVLAGKPDTGKSQFARQLCLQVALGDKDFLGFELKPVHNRSIYVATEDNKEQTAFLASKQLEGLGKKPVENLRFIFADTMEQEEILKKLDEELELYPADLVVVDSFGDIFKGGDTNNNMAMRNTVKMFDRIAKKHNCLILFVHHINKAAYRRAPGQEHIQGGAGLVQKVRLAIQLSEGVANKRYFTVVKGNYCPKEYKENSLELEFSEDSFLFTNSGKIISTSDIGIPQDVNNREKKDNELETIAQTILYDEQMTYGEFVKRFCEITGKSPITAKRAIKALFESGFIEKVEGGDYCLKTLVDEKGGSAEDDEPEEYNGLCS
jgi:KaiC/GvpD/RAD55 family RecA-like ATPase